MRTATTPPLQPCERLIDFCEDHYAYMVFDSDHSYTFHLFEGNFSPEEFFRYQRSAYLFPERTPPPIEGCVDIIDIPIDEPTRHAIESLPIWSMTTKCGLGYMKLLIRRLADIHNDDNAHENLRRLIKEQHEYAAAAFYRGLTENQRRAIAWSQSRECLEPGWRP